MQKATIEAITFSDHAPVTLSLAWSPPSASSSFWRLNDSLLLDNKVIAAIRTEVEYFFTENDTEDAYPFLIWETYKAFSRGIRIKHGARKKKARNKNILHLIKQIELLESRQRLLNTEEIRQQLGQAREQLKDIHVARARVILVRTRRFYIEHGNKSSRLLARALRQQHGQSYIPQIRKANGDISLKPGDILKAFEHLYKNLYNLNPAARFTEEKKEQEDKLMHFFKKLRTAQIN